MNRLPRPVSAAALCMLVCALLVPPASVRAGFDLNIDASSFRFIEATARYEIDVLLSRNAIGENLDTIRNIGIALSFSPALDGAAFVGLSNQSSNRLFPLTARVNAGDPGSFFWPASIQLEDFSPVSVPQNPAVAFTLQMRYDAAVNGTSDIVVSFASFFSNGDSPREFNSLGSAGGLTFVAVPEPNLSLITGAILGGMGLRKRWKRLRLFPKREQ